MSVMYLHIDGLKHDDQWHVDCTPEPKYHIIACRPFPNYYHPGCGYNAKRREIMNDPIITYNKNELYREIELFANGVKIGEAEIEVKGGMLSRLFIYEPYQNKGYGTKVVKMLCDDYGINCLWVKSDNERAIHVYRKCGFHVKKSAMYLMEK